MTEEELRNYDRRYGVTPKLRRKYCPICNVWVLPNCWAMHIESRGHQFMARTDNPMISRESKSDCKTS